MIFLGMVAECFFYTICGWIGHTVVKTITFGKVDLEWGDPPESVVPEWIGVFILCLAGVLVAWLLRL